MTLASRLSRLSDLARHSLACASLTASFAVSFAACGDDEDPIEPPPPPPTAVRAVVVAGDFASTGVLSVVDVAGLSIRTKAVAGAAAADPVIRHLGDEVFVVNRFGPTGSSISILTDDTLEVTHQLSTGTNTNPQDVAVVDDVLYLPALESKGVVVLERSGKASLLDLSDLDPDGKPDCNSVYAVDGKLVITCGLLENFAATRDAKVVIYDPRDGSKIVNTLAARNPIGFLQPTPTSSTFGGDLLVATADYSDAKKQCVLRINPATGASSCAITNAALDGIANRFEADLQTGRLFVAPTFYDDSFSLHGALRTVNLTSGAVEEMAWSPRSQAISDLAVCPDGSVIAIDATFGASGVRIYGSGGGERTSEPLSIGLPPVTQNGVVCY